MSLASSPSVFLGRIGLVSSPFLRRLGVALHRDERQSVAIRRDEAHRVAAQDEQRAIEEIAGVFAGNRKLRLGDHLLERGSRKHHRRSAAALRQRRKILARQRLHPRVEAVGGHLDATLFFGDANVRFRQRLHDLVEFFCRQRERSAFRNRRCAFTAKADFEIGGQKFHFLSFGFHQHVRENRNRVLAFDDSLKKLQFSQEVVLADDKFHGCVDLEVGGDLSPAIP